MHQAVFKQNTLLDYQDVILHLLMSVRMEFGGLWKANAEPSKKAWLPDINSVEAPNKSC